jgi:hypothetical protein
LSHSFVKDWCSSEGDLFRRVVYNHTGMISKVYSFGMQLIAEDKSLMNVAVEAGVKVWIHFLSSPVHP